MRRLRVQIPLPAFNPMAKMIIKTIKVGSLQTNCYVIVDEKTGEAVVIDPGDEAAKILPAVEGLKVRHIIVTHGHPDHFGAIDEVKKATGAPLLMHGGDEWFLVPDRVLKEGDEIRFGELSLKVMHTPGHSPGGICLYREGHLFSGDTLFAEAHGRVDIPGASAAAMRESLKRLSRLPDDTIVYPGHDETTTIQREKERGTFGR